MSKTNGSDKSIDQLTEDAFSEGMLAAGDHANCPEFRAIIEEVERLGVRLQEHVKTCSKKVGHA